MNDWDWFLEEEVFSNRPFWMIVMGFSNDFSSAVVLSIVEAWLLRLGDIEWWVLLREMVAVLFFETFISGQKY